MATYRIKIDTRSKAAKAFIELLKTLPFVKVEEEESPYNPEFVKKIKQARAEKEGLTVTSSNLWQSIK